MNELSRPTREPHRLPDDERDDPDRLPEIAPDAVRLTLREVVEIEKEKARTRRRAGEFPTGPAA